MSGFMTEDPPARGPDKATTTTTTSVITQATTTTDFGTLPATARWDTCTQLAADSVGASAVGTSTTWSIFLQRDHLPTNKLEPPCLPTAYISAVMAGRNPVYSPGTGCPAGYAPMCTSVATGVAVPAATNIQVWSALTSGEIAVGCCPSGYRCVTSSYDYACESTLHVGDTTTVAFLHGYPGSLTEIVVGPTTRVIVDAFRVVYMSAPSTAAAATTTSAAASPSSSPDTKAATGLSTGQKAAIGICIPLAAIAIIAGLVFFFCRRRRRRSVQTPDGEDPAAPRIASTTENGYHKAELDGAESKPIEGTKEGLYTVETGGAVSPPVEMPGSEVEQPARHEVAELPAEERCATPSSTGRQSPVIRRKHVGGTPLSADSVSP